jgi:STE24 endopeptidase
MPPLFSTSDPAAIASMTLALLLALNLLVKFWLASRQVRHVAAHRRQVPTQFADIISLPAHQKAADYTLAKMRLSIWELSVSAITLIGWTLLGGLSGLNQWLMQLVGPGKAQQLALLGSFVLISAAIELPLGLYHTFILERRFGFNNTTWRLWLSDSLKSTILLLLIGTPLAAGVLWLMGAAGAAWWLWAWLLLLGFNLLVMVVYPTFIAPLFNRFEPLQDPVLVERVQALMKRCGFSAKGLFVMDGSKRSAHANAYFTGLGSAKRVVFYDTLLSKLAPGEVDAVLAHELGHFKRRHISKRMVMLFGMSLLSLALLGWLSQKSWFYVGLGVMPNLQGPNDALALLLFTLVLPLASFFFTPLGAWISRQHEFEADAYAAQQTDGRDLCSALLKLYEDNASTLTPDPVYVGFYYSHPGATQRLARLQGAAAPQA